MGKRSRRSPKRSSDRCGEMSRNHFYIKAVEKLPEKRMYLGMRIASISNKGLVITKVLKYGLQHFIKLFAIETN